MRVKFDEWAKREFDDARAWYAGVQSKRMGSFNHGQYPVILSPPAHDTTTS